MATQHLLKPGDGLPERLPGALDVVRGVLQKHGLTIYGLGGDDWYAYCPTHRCPSIVDSFAAALEAECPGCVAQREIELRRLRFRLRLGAV